MKSKKINPIIALSILCITMFSCSKGFEDINRTPDKPDASTVTIPGLFNGIVKDITNEDVTLYVSLFYDYTNQQAVQNNTAPFLNYTSSLWNTYYPILFDYKKLQSLIAGNTAKDRYSNVKYMADILMASKTLHMLDYYGDIPYSNASKADEGDAFRHPAYDKQADVYKAVLADLKAAADGIKTNDATQISLGASESFLGGDYAAWIRFANALRLRYAVRLYGKEQTLCSEIITDIIGGNKPLPENQNPAALAKNNFGFWPKNVSPAIIDNDRKWYSFREFSVSAMRMSSNVWGQMSVNNNTDGSGIFDPRCVIWFQTNNAGQWVPQPQNHSVSDGGQPYPSSKVRPAIGADAANKFSAFNLQFVSEVAVYPYLIISESDVYFLKAEIYQRGMGVVKNIAAAKTAYEAGIKSSVDFWYAYTNLAAWSPLPTPPTGAQMIAFLATPTVLYNGANDADALKKIATQAWLATMWNPAEAWAIVRRTGLTPKDPTYTPAVTNKLPYPEDEKTNNYANWQTATGGADPGAQILTKVYWMP